MKVVCKQIKPLTVKILGAFLFILTIWMMVQYQSPTSQIVVMFLISFILLGYQVSFEFTKGYKNKRLLKLFGIVVWSSKMDSIFPDYIKIYSGHYKQDSEFGPVSALGNSRQYGFYAVRFFKGNKHFTPFKSTHMEEVLSKAKELSALLEVELLDR